MGDSITEGTLIEWTKGVGDTVETDEIIGVIETDKVSMDIRAPQAGTIVAFHANIDDTVEVGNKLLDLDTANVGGAGGAPQATTTTSEVESTTTTTTTEQDVSSSSEPGKMIPVNVPPMGDSITEGTIQSIEKEVGDAVEIDEIICVIETDKVSTDVRSPVAGKLSAIHVSVDDTVQVDGPLFEVEEGAAGKAAVTSSSPGTDESESSPAVTTTAPSSEASSKAQAPSSSSAGPSSSSTGGSPPSVTGERIERRVKMTRMRQAVARNLKGAQNVKAQLTTFQECDMSALVELRKEYKDKFEETHGVRLGFMGMFMKACAAALKEIPAVNGVIDDETNEIVYHDFVDIRVAAASPKGML
eukprot:g1912.t1